MTGSHLFTLGLFQKNFNSTSRVTGPAINMGCTRGRGSTTRMLNYCKQHSTIPSLCINQFITSNESSYNLRSNYVGSAFYPHNMSNNYFKKDLIINHNNIDENIDITNHVVIINDININNNKNIDITNDDIDITNEDMNITNEDMNITNEDMNIIGDSIDDNNLPEVFDLYFMRENNSEEWFDNNDL